MGNSSSKENSKVNLFLVSTLVLLAASITLSFVIRSNPEFLESVLSKLPIREKKEVITEEKNLNYFSHTYFNEDPILQSRQTKQGLVSGEALLDSFIYIEEDGKRTFTKTKTVIGDSGFTKYIIVHGELDVVPVIKKGSHDLPFLDHETRFEGFKLYLTDSGVGLAENITKDKRFVADFVLSDNGRMLGFLETEPVESSERKSEACFTCADVEFNLYLVRYDLQKNERVAEVELKPVNVLIDPKSPTTLENLDLVDLTASNVSSIDLKDPELAHLHGNDLLDLRLSISPDGSKFVYENIGLYAVIDNVLKEILSPDQLGNLENVNSDIQYEWVSENIISVILDSRKKVYLINVEDGTESIATLKGGQLLSLHLWEDNSLLYLLKEESKHEFGLVGSNLKFEDKKALGTFQAANFPEVDSVENIFITLIDQERSEVYFMVNNGVVHYKLQQSGEFVRVK